MRIHPVSLWILAAIFTLIAPMQPVLAARGVPGSSEFGYGAHLNQGGPYSIEGVRLASDLQVDWLQVDLSWQSIAPKQGSLDWSRIDAVLQASAHSDPSVMVSLTEPPEWAQTAQGPDPAFVNQLVGLLVQKYPRVIKAIELFPAANTRAGWGRPPNANAYLKSLQAAQSALQKLQSKTLLIAGGLQPVAASDQAQGMEDLAFLQALYGAGLKNLVNIVSLNASNLTGEPLQAPEKTEPRLLRHYEEIRAVMLQNNHESGLIWLTHLSPPSDKSRGGNSKAADKVTQADWLNRAYGQVKSQLYIGVAFLDGINPSNQNPGAIALIENGGDYHPFYRTLRELININRSDSSHNRPGRAKDQPLQKNVK